MVRVHALRHSTVLHPNTRAEYPPNDGLTPGLSALIWEQQGDGEHKM